MNLPLPALRAIPLGRALSAKVRSGILEHLTRRPGERMTDIANALGIPLGTVSHHIARLQALGLLHIETSGREKLLMISREWLEPLSALFTYLSEGDNTQ